MTWWSPLPVTAVVAILLFVGKEALEFIRRVQGDRRKRRALKDLLARECELNLWVVTSLRRIFDRLRASAEPGARLKVAVSHRAGGRPYARFFSETGGLDTQVGIPRPHRELMSRFLLDVATLDRDLFDHVEPAYEALARLEHLRETLVNADEEAALVGEDQDLGALARHALVQLSRAEAALGALYRHCTGQPLVPLSMP